MIKELERGRCPHCGKLSASITSVRFSYENWGYQSKGKPVGFKATRHCIECGKDFSEYYEGYYAGTEIPDKPNK